MLNLILMLISLAFGNNNANTATYDNNQTTVTAQSDTDLGDGIDPEDGEPVGGNSGQLPPPPLTQP